MFQMVMKTVKSLKKRVKKETMSIKINRYKHLPDFDKPVTIKEFLDHNVTYFEEISKYNH